ncbi:hypothetical protein E4U42_004851 [Claviceps africana]|uniref:Homeobox domain-containing protein n=1 Tax=Claviceps africana TaxID=83212 RepID=A0A8K0J578_9HYPO|nr:hypothetical protein E4U42_004851 [Claviceps africana]
MASFSQSQWPSWAYSNISDPFHNYSNFSNYSGFLADSLEAYQTQHNRLVQHQHMSRATESKPRLSKEEVEVLEAEFQKNHKPSSSTKKALAESMRVDNARINNWFQNRRAREKKENNIREYEAKQQLEKDRADPEQLSQPAKNCQRDFVASSAPFPQPGASPKQHSEESLSPLDASVPDETSDAGQCSDSDSASPHPLPLAAPEHEHIHNFDQGDEEDDNSSALSDRMNHYLAMQESSMLDVGGGGAASLQYLTGFSAPESIQQSVERYDNDNDVDLSTSSSPLDGDYDVSFTNGMDIASRRNRRPAPLSIGGGPRNSYTNRANQAACMHRISSSTSSGRVTKSVATPRSPFFDRSALSLLQRVPSPRAAGRHGSAAPPTPDTPITLQSQESFGAPAPYTLNSGKFTPPDAYASDPTLRTPPTTPGFSDGLFHFGSGYDMSISQEPLIAPDMGRLHTGMGMAGDAAAFTNYLSPISNQSSTPNMATMYQAQLSRSYLGFAGSDTNCNYSWSDPSTSTASASSNTRRYMTLNNMSS